MCAQVTVLTRSYNPYNFTPQGFTSKGTNGGQHYKISEKDIWIIRRQVCMWVRVRVRLWMGVLLVLQGLPEKMLVDL